MISDDKIAEIRERASIVEVISDHLTLKQTGRNLLGLCPFHSEKTPSFTVNAEKGIFHCFGCGVGGNIFNFLMHYDHLSFPEAVESVGRRYGIEVQRLDRPEARQRAQERDGLYRVNEQVAGYYHRMLFGNSEGGKALKYLDSRGIDRGAARRFYLGYAPSWGQGLVGFLKKEGLSLRDAIRLGFLSERGSGRYGEKFFDRLIFPIIDPGGRFVGFGGRVLGKGMPKYLNSAETPLFRKGSQLYGLYQAKDAIRQKDRIVVVEGYLDVLAMAQEGVSYVVATLGTALTPDHIRTLRRYTKNVIALFDGDGAGKKAAARSFEVFVEGGLLGRAAFLPEGEDPDTFVRSQGKEAMEAVIDRAIPLADYYFTWQHEQNGMSLEGKGLVAQEISRVLAKVKSPFEYDLLVRRGADSLGISEDLLRRSAVNRPQPGAPRQEEKAKGAGVQMREDLADSSLVSLMLRFPSVIQRVDQDGALERLVDPKWKDVVRIILDDWKKRGSVDVGRLAQSLPPERASEVTALVLQGEVIPESERDKMAEDCTFYLRRRYLKALASNLREAIRLAEESKDEKVKKERMQEWQKVVQKERDLERQRFVPKMEVR